MTIKEVQMPALSPTMKHGTLAKWHKKEGDVIKSGDIIADIETDKATMEFEYIDEDAIVGKIIVPEGEKKVPVNNLIAILVTDKQELNSLENYQQNYQSKPSTAADREINKHEDKTSQEDKILENKSSQRIKISPLAKKIAFNKNVDIKSIKGTGPYNRIIKADILEAANNKSSIANNNLENNTVTEVNVSTIRQAIAHRLLESKQTIPHFYLTIDCIVGELLSLRSKINSSDADNKITVNDFIIKAVALSMKKFPAVNSSWINDTILQYSSIDIAIAVALNDGLITPIITKADQKSLLHISKEVKSLVSKAKSGQLKPEEFQGGGFTISNLGMFGIKEFSAIINPPQSCIMAVGKSEKRAIVIEDTISIANVMTVTLSVDHRTVDGALAATFLECFKNYIEQPTLMLI